MKKPAPTGICYLAREPLRTWVMPYSKLYRSFLFPFYETHLRHRKTLEYLDELESNQWLSEEELKEIQWAKLEKLLKHVYQHVPYYRRKFDEIRARPSDIRNIDDFTHFPFLTKKDVQDFGSELVADNYAGKNVCQNETSGSTGQPLIFFYPRESYERRLAAKIRSESWIGLDPGVRTAMIWGRYVSERTLKRLKKSLYWRLQNVKHICAYQLDDRSLHDIINKLNRFKPQFIVSYVTPIYHLSRLATQYQISVYSPQGVLACAETLFPYQRDLIEKCFDTEVYSRYGCCEFMNISAECSRKEGLHTNIDNLVVEFVKPEINGDYGDLREIVVTDLHNYGMPFIRYRLGDIGRPIDRKCSCGRGLPLMDMVHGRINNVILTPDGKIVPDHLFLYIFAEIRGVRKYQIVQNKVEELIIRLVTDSLYSSHVEHEIGSMARSVLSNRINLKFEYVEDIPLEENAKFKYTISNVCELHT